MKNTLRSFRSVLTFLGALCVAVVLLENVCPSLGTAVGSLFNQDGKTLLESTRSVNVTSVTVSSTLESIGELATTESTYSGYAQWDHPRDIFGWNVPFTENHVDFAYSGVIKVGFEVADISVSVHGQVIEITLPEPKVVSNHASVVGKVNTCNNLVNPLDGTETAEMLASEEESQLEKAINDGLYKRAARDARVLIKETLVDFALAGYEIRFTN